MTAAPIPRLPNPLTPKSIEGLMNERPYWDTSHPRSQLYRRLVQRGFEIMYPNTRYDEFGRMIDLKPLKPEYITHLVVEVNREMEKMERALGSDGEARDWESQRGGGAVHVQSHSREGGKVEVADYWRAAPGEGSGSERESESPKVRNLLDDAENAGNAQAGTDDDRPKSVSPVPNPVIRNDGAGGGYFGASREGGPPHKGIDILAKPGDEVVSPVDGTIDMITPAYSDPKFKGLETIVIKGDDGREYKFLYVTPKDGEGQTTVKEKDRVSAGDPIGTVQDRAAYEPSGKMKNHVHIEIRDKSKKVVDPTPQVEEWQNRP